MRDSLPKSKPWQYECMIVNHDSIENNGTHWTCFAKINSDAFYFDSFGKLAPPLEIIEYLGSECHVFYNSKQYQQFNTNICGHLCLKFLHEFFIQRDIQ